MTSTGWEIVGRNDRDFPGERSLGEAVRGLVRRRWASNAAKMLEREWDLDPKTARNVVGAGNVSERTLSKAIRAEGWAFLAELGEELTGHTYDQHLQAVIERETRVQEQRTWERDRVHQMENRARQLGGLPPRAPA